MAATGIKLIYIYICSFTKTSLVSLSRDALIVKYIFFYKEKTYEDQLYLNLNFGFCKNNK